MLIVNDEDEIEEPEVKGTEEEEPEMKVMEVANNVKIVLHLILGFSTKGTMKLKGLITGREVIVMVNCGATYNFIHKKLVDELNLPLTLTLNYGVVVGNGEAYCGKGICKAIVVLLPGLRLTEDFLPFELGRVNVILRMIPLCNMGYLE